MRTKKALYNIVSQMTYEIVAMICGLILPRFILAGFGSSYNGMVSSITQFLDYISFLTLGIAGSTRVALYKARAKNDIIAISAVVKANERYMRRVAIAFIAYVGILTVVYPYIVRNDFRWAESASLVVIIGLGTFAEYFFGITYSTFLAASQSVYIYNIIQIFSKIANTIVSVVLIKAGYSIQIVKLGSAICFVVSPIILHYLVRKKYGLRSDVEPDKDALKQRGDVMAHSIANIIHQYTDVFLLTLFTSPAVVSVYSVYVLVLGSLRKLQNVFTNGLEGAFGDLWAKGETERFKKNFDTFEYLIFGFVSVVFSCAGLLIIPFVSLYTDGINDIEYIIPSFAILSVTSYAMNCLRMPYIIAVQAAGRYKETKIGAFVEAGLNFGISIICVFKFGLIGVTIGTVVATTFRTVQYSLYLSNKMLNRSYWLVIKKFLWLSLNVSLVITIHQILQIKPISGWVDWIVNGMLWFTIALAVTVGSSFVLYRSDLKESLVIIRKMFMRKTGGKK